MKGNERRGRAGRNRTEGATEEGREEGRKGPVKSVKPGARKVLLVHPCSFIFPDSGISRKLFLFDRATSDVQRQRRSETSSDD